MPPDSMIHNSINRDRFFQYNPNQQRYNFKTFQEFVMTCVPQEFHNSVEIPQRYHPFLNFGQLLEQWYILKLKKELLENYGADAPFEYGINERRKIF